GPLVGQGEAVVGLAAGHGSQARSRLRLAAFQTLRQRPRVSAALARSAAISWPATRATSRRAAWGSQASPTTGSWWSPRTLWRSAMASANVSAGLPITGSTASAADGGPLGPGRG